MILLLSSHGPGKRFIYWNNPEKSFRRVTYGNILIHIWINTTLQLLACVPQPSETLKNNT